MTKRARRLRRNMTNVEQKLWLLLRKGGVDGIAFRRQHPLGRYVLDFYCPALKLAIELDGGQHDSVGQRSRDVERTRHLARRGISVLRFWNNEVNENLEGILSEIRRQTQSLRRRGGTPTPALPLPGGGSSFGEVDR